MRLILRPTIFGSTDQVEQNVVYVLERRSLFDLIVLDLVTRELELRSPLDGLVDLEESRSFFFLFRAVGARGKVTMYRFSERLRRLQEKLGGELTHEIVLIPVSIYWGRTNDKAGSILRSFVSEDWRTSRGLRRALGIVFARTDLLVHIHRPIDWTEITDTTQSVPQNLRHVARVLRSSFKSSRLTALGPSLVARRTVIRELAAVRQDDPKSIARRRKLAEKLVSNLSYPAMRTLKLMLDVFWRKVYDRIELLHADRIQQIASTHTIVYVPNHRSHIDYLVLSYLLFIEGIAIPHIAAGENLDLPVIGGLLRRCGAFFMRRSYRDDPAYRTLLADYVGRLLSEGHSIEFFIEGTRSRSGWMLEPRLGFLQIVLEQAAQESTRPIAFVPIYTGYERLVESESYRAELLGEAKQSENLQDALQAVKLLRKRFGLLQVSVGEPLITDSWLSITDSDHRSIRSLGDQVSFAINHTAVISATNLIASAIFGYGIGLITIDQLVARIDFLRTLGRVESLHNNHEYPLHSAHELIKHVAELGFYVITDDAIDVSNETLANLAWFRNNTLHTLATPAILAVVLLHQTNAVSRLDLVRQVAGVLPHVAAVLRVPLDLHAVKRWLTHFRNAQLTQETATHMIEVCVDQTSETSELRGLANLIAPMLECMYVTTSRVATVEPYALAEEALIDASLESVEHFTSQHDTTSMLGFDRRFFTSFVRQLVLSGLLEQNENEHLAPTQRLQVIQRRAAGAINPAFRTELDRYLLDETR